jgi:hypothetical protein
MAGPLKLLADRGAEADELPARPADRPDAQGARVSSRRGFWARKRGQAPSLSALLWVVLSVGVAEAPAVASGPVVVRTFKVGVNAVRQARALPDEAPDLAEQVESRAVSLAPAVRFPQPGICPFPAQLDSPGRVLVSGREC